MSRAEKFISDCTRNCSNEFEPQKAPPSVYNPWLTPDQARSAVEIAREETIKEVCEWLNNNVFRYVDSEEEIGFPMYYTTECIEDLKKHLEDKV